MELAVLGLLVVLGQRNTLQSRPVVRLSPNRAAVDASLDGKLLELVNAPLVVSLPAPPRPAAPGTPWSLDVKNLGPAAVTLSAKSGFTVVLSVGETAHIVSDGATYSRKR